MSSIAFQYYQLKLDLVVYASKLCDKLSQYMDACLIGSMECSEATRKTYQDWSCIYAHLIEDCSFLCINLNLLSMSYYYLRFRKNYEKLFSKRYKNYIDLFQCTEKTLSNELSFVKNEPEKAKDKIDNYRLKLESILKEIINGQYN